jgi:hypothetical protein
LIAQPNDHIFPNGVNILIFHLLDNDITNNVELICPTNHYSNEFFDPNKKSIIILKKGNYYEPLYIYKSKKQYKAEAYAFFDTKHNSTLSQKFKEMIMTVVRHRLESCKPRPSLPNVYKFAQPILLANLIDILEHMKKTTILSQVMMNGKIIGVQVKYIEKGEWIGYIPCYPSSPLKYDYIMISDCRWNTYEATLTFLQKISAFHLVVTPIQDEVVHPRLMISLDIYADYH